MSSRCVLFVNSNLWFSWIVCGINKNRSWSIRKPCSYVQALDRVAEFSPFFDMAQGPQVSGPSTAYSGSIADKAADVAFLSEASDSAGACALILDLGSGFECQAARFLSSSRRRICCLDVNEAALKTAMLKMGPCADGVLADMTGIHRAFRPGMFDLICCFYSLQHISQPSDCIRSLMVLSNRNCIALSVLLDRDVDGHPLPQPLKSCYKSFLGLGELGKAFEAEGWKHFSWSRNEVYVESNEFPCQREYVIGRGSHFKRSILPDAREEPHTTKARRKSALDSCVVYFALDLKPFSCLFSVLLHQPSGEGSSELSREVRQAEC